MSPQMNVFQLLHMNIDVLIEIEIPYMYKSLYKNI